ncbi:OPT/YSL family transporter [bacterium SCSIO 12827]|nr:OPT/YSL family transporter [bacterium SCSIO 12827]
MEQESPAEFTRRAVLTGLILGAALTPCNVYSGLKIGWSFNMSIAAGLLAVGAWRLAERSLGTAPLGIKENNINQTAASASASIVSGGLVAPIPALTLLTGQTLQWPVLAFWVFCVSILGVVVAAGLRRQMIEHENLAFPAGLATAETLKRIHGKGREQGARLRALLAAAGVSAAAKLAVDLAAAVPRLALPGSLPGGVTFKNLGLAFDPSLLMIGFGALIGPRAGLSLLLGAVASWGLLAPWVLDQGWAQAGAPGTVWFSELVAWLLWPGVTLTVVAALTSFAISVLRLRRRLKASGGLGGRTGRGYALALAVVTALICIAGWTLFGLPVWVSVLAVALSYVLAVIAARVSGETGVTPVGALGKVTQLTYGAITPGDMAANLMTANVTGGAAGQCADMMHDLKTGSLIGAAPRLQIYAQALGVLTGSLAGAAVYLILIPDPAAMLMTPEWPAPAVATWKAVAEVMAAGLGAIPEGAAPAMAIAAVLGVILGVADRVLPERIARWLPSAPAAGVAFVIPAWNSISLCLGAMVAAVAAHLNPRWTERYGTAVAAGLVAGESLIGVGLAIPRMAG